MPSKENPMASMSNYLENKLVDHIFRAMAYTMPSELWVALYTAAPSDSGGGTEVSGGSYARAQLDPAYDDWKGTGGEVTDTPSAGTGGQTKNAEVITYPAPTGDWGQVTHWGIFDDESAGNLLAHGALTTPKTINNGDPAPTFAVDAIVFTFA
jgi:hypothetical protein